MLDSIHLIHSRAHRQNYKFNHSRAVVRHFVICFKMSTSSETVQFRRKHLKINIPVKTPLHSPESRHVTLNVIVMKRFEKTDALYVTMALDFGPKVIGLSVVVTLPCIYMYFNFLFVCFWRSLKKKH